MEQRVPCSICKVHQSPSQPSFLLDFPFPSIFKAIKLLKVLINEYFFYEKEEEERVRRNEIKISLCN